MSYIEVYYGSFYCENCGASWWGTWHGPKNKITCVKCEKPISSEAAKREGEENGRE